MTSSRNSTSDEFSSLSKGADWRHGDIHLVGLSLSGIRTSIAMPELKICFDLALGLPYAMHMKKFFITHGHMDHAGGIPYVISQRNITSDPHTVFYMPQSMVEPMTEIMRQWEKIENHKYVHSFHGIDEKSVLEINSTHFARPFKTLHRVESFGYTVYEKRKKLKPEYASAQREELLHLKAQKHDLNTVVEIPLISFTGDTQIDFLDLSPQVKKSKVLVCEVTYYGPKKSIEHARTWGHTHLDELIPRLKEIESEKILLIHGSSRYSYRDMNEELQRKLPSSEKDRVKIFQGR